MSTDQLNEIRKIAGFWRRLGAFFLDCFLLGLIGIAVGYFFAEEFVSLGAWGRLLGFFVAITYFGLLNSKLSGGQTFGKRMLKIKVVAKDGVPLSVRKAFLRFLPLGAPWFLNNAQFSESVLFSFWIYLLSVVIFGIGLSVIYLYVFNRKSRQSLHDLMVGSYVVSAEAVGPVVTAAPWQVHLAVCILLVVASSILPYFTMNLAAREPFASLTNIYRTVNSEPWVVNAQVNKGQTFISSTDKSQSTTTYLSIAAYSKDSDIENVERARRLATLALSADSSAADLAVINVMLVYGYDIGIASSWRSHNITHTPAEWLAQ
jgi:uncharacterized RDD family membrane protein YckC